MQSFTPDIPKQSFGLYGLKQLRAQQFALPEDALRASHIRAELATWRCGNSEVSELPNRIFEMIAASRASIKHLCSKAQIDVIKVSPEPIVRVPGSPFGAACGESESFAA